MSTYDMELAKVLYKERIQAAEALRKNYANTEIRLNRSEPRLPGFSKALIALAQKLNAQPQTNLPPVSAKKPL